MSLPNIAEDLRVTEIIRNALAEDLGDAGDVTSSSVISSEASTGAEIIAREACVVSGLAVAEGVFASVDASLVCESEVDDGRAVEPGAVILTIKGAAQSILTAERTALNFLQRMCGIATKTRQFVELIKDTGATILDTRKTTPGLRILEKYAVLCGGGENHRMGLYDRVMIKDNHRRFWDCDGLDKAIEAARAKYPGIPVEVEIEDENELKSALRASPEWILCDNMGPDPLRRCVAICGGKCRVEASGGITLETIRAIAEAGVDAISLGCLTHSVRAVDLSLELMP